MAKRKQNDDIDKIIEQELNEETGLSVAVKQLTSDVLDEDKNLNLSDIDFKTNLHIKEILSQASLEWLNDVVTNKEKFKEELMITKLIRRLKRLRVSEGAMARKGIQDIFISENQKMLNAGSNESSKWFKQRE